MAPFARGAGQLAEMLSAGGSTPWYRRPDVWLFIGVVLLPFGWVLALCRVAWIAIQAWRRRRAHARSRASRRGGAIAPAPTSSPSA